MIIGVVAGLGQRLQSCTFLAAIGRYDLLLHLSPVIGSNAPSLLS